MRRPAGRETWHRLLEWDRGQADSERLAARLLAAEGFDAIDPSHPLGGRDGGRDILCKRDGESCVVGIYFPRGQQKQIDIVSKFESDLAKADKFSAAGFVFVTNQELTLSERAQLQALSEKLWIEVYHLERIASCLDSPNGYGLRLEFLQIEMTKEEQVSFINSRDQLLYEIRAAVLRKPDLKAADGIKTVQVQSPDLLSAYSALTGSKLMECKKCETIFRATRNPLVGMIDPDGVSVVTCPNCGHTQRFK